MHEIDRRGEALGGSKNRILGRTRRRLLIYLFPLFWFLDLSIKQLHLVEPVLQPTARTR